MKQYKSEALLRLFFILMLLWLHAVKSLIIIIAILQLLTISIEKKPIDSLIIISQLLLSYVFDIMEYLTGISPKAPFPFSPWRNRYDP
jgi:hypothetical protein